MPWYSNRKFMSPILASIASIIVVVAVEVLPEFSIPADIIAAWLGFIWFAAGAIVVGDIGYDWIGEAVKVLKPTVDFAAERDWVPGSQLDEEAWALLRRLLDEVRNEGHDSGA